MIVDNYFDLKNRERTSDIQLIERLCISLGLDPVRLRVSMAHKND